jgi:CHASE3 domain sensor protein
MNRLSIETKVLGGFGAALAVLAVTGFLAYQSTLEFVRTSDSIARSREITETLENIFSVLSQAESGQRGYLFTGDEAFLQPRHGALARLEELVARLKQQTVDYPEQLQRVARSSAASSSACALIA